MADVQYKSSTEPKVTVHGLPKSEYDAQAAGVASGGGVPEQGGGIMGNIKRHWPIYTLILGAVTIVVIIWAAQQNSANAAQGTTTGTGTGTGNSSPDQLFGAQLETDYQQMISEQNANNGLLTQILNKIGGQQNSGNDGPGINTRGTFHTSNFGPFQGYFGNNSVPNADPKNTGKESNNFWVYTTKAGDTLATITNMAKWGTNYNKTYTYRNNSDILHAVGYDVTNPNQVLPTGLRISV